MIPLDKKHSPHFILLPYINNRTAWRPVNFPSILVVPDRRDPSGASISDSKVFNVRVQIEDVPRRARVAGHDHVGIFFPDRELFAKSVSSLELADMMLELDGLDFYTKDGQAIDYLDAQSGDYFEYTSYSGIRDRIEYLATADYYDLSNVLVETNTLPPDRYVLSYNADYYVRHTLGQENTDGELVCIDSSRTATAVKRIDINHPGEVIEDLYRHTPAVYLGSANKSEDRTVEFYRPFTDLLQNVFDEQSFLERLNHADSILPQYLPYLSYLLGLDIPYFPLSLDKLRRTMLQNVVRISRLKGSRRAIVELFELFGYNILLANLWWSADGKRLIRPGQTLPLEYKDQEISIEQKCQIEPVVVNYTDSGFGELEVPLLYRPQDAEFISDFLNNLSSSKITLYSYYVEKESLASSDLNAIAAAMESDPSGYGDGVNCAIPTVNNLGIIGYSEVEIDGASGDSITLYETGLSPVINHGVKYDRQRNILAVTFNGHLEFDNGKELFIFAKYNRTDLIVPEILQNIRSNRFDLQILTNEGEQVSADIIEFLINFLFKLKAFHSLLNVIRFDIGLTEVYEVTDWTVGGNVSQRYDMDAGRLQVPPAIIPNIIEGDCRRDSETLGYKPEDIALRNTKLQNLIEQHQAWKDLDDRQSGGPDTYISPTDGDTDRSSCIYNYNGQDRILITDKTEEDDVTYSPTPGTTVPSGGVMTGINQFPVDDVSQGQYSPYGGGASGTSDTGSFGSFMRQKTSKPTAHCELDGVTDYAYRGRVNDELLYQLRNQNAESYQNAPCSLNLGDGVYYLMLEHNETGCGVDHLSTVCNSFLGRLSRAYGTPQYPIMYSNRIGYTEEQFAIQRPQLNMSDTILHFPGCRFATLNRLAEDFESDTWRAKPWDEQYSDSCNPTWLNAELVDNLLVYDDLPFTIVGNGLVADIPNMSDHLNANVSNDKVVHSVFISQPDGHEAITLEDVCDTGTGTWTDTGTGIGEMSTDGTIIVNDPLFPSSTLCGTGEYIDNAAGYPCITGFQYFEDVDFGREGLYDELYEELEVPHDDDTGTVHQLLFFMGSGIKDGTGHRLDCDCSDIECSGTEVIDVDCTLDHYINQQGYRDWNADQLEIIPYMSLVEPLGGYCNILDGSINNMFEFI